MIRTLKTRLYAIQYEELREKLSFSYSLEDLECIGADTSAWSSIDYGNWHCGVITDEMIEKSFSGYCFGCDDFSCTAFNYDNFSETDTDFVHTWGC